MRTILMLSLVAGCSGSSPRHPSEAARLDLRCGGSLANIPSHALPAHRGATELWHDHDLWVSVAGKDVIRLSHGTGPLELTVLGRMIGVHDGRAFVAARSGDQVVLQSYGGPGAPTKLGTLPALADPDSYTYLVTADGEVAAVRQGSSNALTIVGASGARTLALDAWVRVEDAAADPFKPRLVLSVANDGVGGIATRMLFIDTRELRVIADRPRFETTRDATFLSTGSLVFTLGRTAEHQLVQLADATETKLHDFPNGQGVSDLSVATDGSAIAYTLETASNDMTGHSGGDCSGYYVALGRDVTRADACTVSCDAGTARAIVDGALWIAPP